MGLSTQFVDTAVTLDVELSPRKLDLIGIKGIIELLTLNGKVNRKTGKPLDISTVTLLTQRDPTFPEPWLDRSTGSSRPLWRRADVEKWLPTWEQKDGPKPYKADALVRVIESEPDRIWTVRELVIRLRRNKVFAEVDDLPKVVRDLAAKVAQQGRVRRVELGRYQSLQTGVKQAAKNGG